MQGVFIGDSCLDIDVYVGRKIVEQSEVVRVEFVPGGSGGNAAYVASLGSNNIAFLTAIGRDPQSSLLKSLIEKIYPNLKVTFLPSTTGETCTVINIINRRGVRRTYFRLRPVFPRDFYNNLPENADIVVVSGYTLELVSIDSLIRALETYNDALKIFMLHPRAVFYSEALFKRILPLIDIVVGNLGEYKRLYGEASVVALTRRLSSLENPGIKIITRGSKGVIVVERKSVFRERAYRPKNIATLKGAGDSFVGGMTSFLLNGLSLEESIRGGLRVAEAWISGDKARIVDILSHQR